MSLLSIGSFALAMLILAASPGPGVMATVARSLASGFRPALAVIAGIILGDILFLLFAIFGLGLIAQALGSLFVVVKVLGGGYLIWQGLRLWLSRNEPETDQLQPAGSVYGNFWSGLFITLGNPKVILFYCGFLPNFISLTEIVPGDVLIIVLIIATVLFLVLGSYAWLADSARKLLSTPQQRKRLDRMAGGIMITSGVVIASRS